VSKAFHVPFQGGSPPYGSLDTRRRLRPFRATLDSYASKYCMLEHGHSRPRHASCLARAACQLAASPPQTRRVLPRSRQPPAISSIALVEAPSGLPSAVSESAALLLEPRRLEHVRILLSPRLEGGGLREELHRRGGVAVAGADPVELEHCENGRGGRVNRAA
jgi:hypothetical protein